MTTSGKCAAHRAAAQQAADAQRPSSSARGYDPKHQRRRKREEPRVNAGGVICWRCGFEIIPGTPWDLGHDDNDRTVYRGPEHASCNRATRAHSKSGGKVG